MVLVISSFISHATILRNLVFKHLRMTITLRLSCYRATIELGDVTPHNLQQLKRLNQVVFPVSYNDKFYKDILEAGELAKLGKKCVIAGFKFCSILTKSID